DSDGLHIDWSNGALAETGEGLPGDRGPMAFREFISGRAASEDAYRRLAHDVQLIPVDSATRVQDLTVTNNALLVKVNAFVKAAKADDPVFAPDGTATVTLHEQLWGESGLADVITGRTASGTVTPAPGASGAMQVVTSPLPLAASNSSVIVDARELGAQPALLPHLRDVKGKVIDFGTAALSVKYFKDGAEYDQSAGLNPLRLKAEHTQGTLHADLVLTSIASDALKSALLNKKVGATTPVLILL
ncbi:MAG TPA: hypothetical protein V6D47_10395, partial [Oscillatoriaceae cyanobacterium]